MKKLLVLLIFVISITGIFFLIFWKKDSVTQTKRFPKPAGKVPLGQIVYNGVSFQPQLLTVQMTTAANVAIVNKSGKDINLIIKSNDKNNLRVIKLSMKANDTVKFRGVTFYDAGIYTVLNQENPSQFAGIALVKTVGPTPKK